MSKTYVVVWQERASYRAVVEMPDDFDPDDDPEDDLLCAAQDDPDKKDIFSECEVLDVEELPLDKEPIFILHPREEEKDD